MEATALCESIFQFVGHGGPEHVSTSNLSMPSTKTVRAGEVGEGATAAAATSTTQPLLMEAEKSSDTSINTAPQHQVENEEIMRAFVGNKASDVLSILIMYASFLIYEVYHKKQDSYCIYTWAVTATCTCEVPVRIYNEARPRERSDRGRFCL